VKLTDFPPKDCLTLIQSILYRYHSAKDRWQSGRGLRTEVHLSIEDARLIYASGQWLKRYSDWKIESDKAKGSIGVYPAEHGLKVCSEFIIKLAAEMNKEEPVISLSDKDMKVLASAAYHIDHYDLMIAANDKKSGHWKKR
jgi:hypothetical protein